MAKVTTVKQWTKDNVNYEIKHIQLVDEPYFSLMPDAALINKGHYCGYATMQGILPKQSILDDIDIHGGITWSEQIAGGKFTIGFDCAHYGDTPDMYSIDELTEMCESMASQLRGKNEHA